MAKFVRNPLQVLILSTLLLLPSLSFAGGNSKQEILNRAEKIRLQDGTGKVLFIRFQEGREFPFAEIQSLAQSVLDLDESTTFQLLKEERDQLGMTHYRFQQLADGVPVLGGTYIAHVKNGLIQSFNGEMFRVSQSASPALSEQSALNQALAHVNGSRYKWELPEEEAYIKVLKNDPEASWFPSGSLEYAPLEGKKRNEFRLCWKFDVYAIEPLYRAEVYVDAASGAIVMENQLIHHTDVQATAITKYSDTVRIITDSVGLGQYRLYEAGRGGGIHTRNMQNGTSQANWVEFTDTDNFWNNFNPAIDEIGGDGHWAMEMTYDYYISKHNRSSYDNSGSPLICNLHYGVNYQNAFWDGNSAQFGDAGGLPFAPIDVVGHEVSHGVVGTSAGLIYQDESGALNESFADIFGNSIEFYGKPSKFKWKVGEDMTSNGAGIRDMSNPQAFGDPDTYFGQGWATGTFDNGGVHTNSGVQNHWYYLLVEGGSGTNDKGDPYTVQGLGWDTASSIAYRNLTVYLTGFSDYSDAQFYAIEAANDLYGQCSTPMQETMNAWHAVGVGAPFAAQVIASFTEDYSEFCYSPGTVQFTNTSAGALTYHWNFGDGNVSSLYSPSHTFFGSGAFDVTLMVTGCGGSKDTLIKMDHIVIDPGAHCNMNMPLNSTDSRESCTGTLWDSGGPTANYYNNNKSKLLIAPAAAVSVTLTFTSFDFANSGDFLQIYDGSDEFAPLIGTYSGNSLPNGGTITSTGPTIFIVESTNGFQNFPGFELEWSCAVSVDESIGLGSALNVYPNPSKGWLNIDFDLVQGGSYAIGLTDLLGKELLKQNGFARGFTSHKLDLNSLPKGMYLLNFRTEKGMLSRKIVLE